MFAAAVRQHRRRLGLTQEELAERTGLSTRGLRKIEAGQVAAPRPATVRLLAGVFGLTGVDRERFCALADPAAPAAREAAVPAQLPLDAAGFAGRADHLQQLSALLADASRQPTAVPVVVLTGAPGVGKTTLAVHWAHLIRDAFPDGQLYVNLRGFDPSRPAVDPADALRGFLNALDVPAAQLPPTVDELAARYRSMLLDRRVLVLLDNIGDAEQVRPLLPAAPGCLAVLTSRTHLTGLVATEGAHPVEVGVMPGQDARRLLAVRLGERRVAAEPRAVDQIVERCAGLPLALAITAARAATRPEQPLARLAGELRDRLGALSDTDAAGDARTVFSWSYRALLPAAARLFRLLSLHPGPDLAAPAAASLAGAPLDATSALLAELTRGHLVTEPHPGRYGFHDLLRAYAAEQALCQDRDGDRREALTRMLDHYLHTAHAGAVLLEPHRVAIDLPPAAGIVTERLADQQQAYDWFTAEKAVLLGLIDHAHRSGHDEHAWQLAWATTEFLQRRGNWHEWAASQQVALEATRRLGNLPQQARAHRNLGRAYTYLRQDEQANAHYLGALRLLEATDDHAGRANAHLNLANLCDRQGRFRPGLDHAEQALALFETAGTRNGVARALNATGWFHSRLGDHRAALACCERALTELRELDDRVGQAHAWDSVGDAHYHLGDLDEATACFDRSLELFREAGDRYYEATILVHLGDAALAAGGRTAAHRAWNRSHDLLAELNDPDPDNTLAGFHLDPRAAQERAG